MKLSLLLQRIQTLLHSKYPGTAKHISLLSHFYLECCDWDRYLPFHVLLSGEIVSGSELKGWTITRVNNITWLQYIKLYLQTLNLRFNPCVHLERFLIMLHLFNYIDELNFKTVTVMRNKDVKRIDVVYVSKPPHNLKWSEAIPTYSSSYSNHFTFDNFDVQSNQKALKSEIDRLVANRDSYPTLHFHIEKNGGGDLVPVHLILRCLTGKKEKWMTGISKLKTSGKLQEWDCWKEENGPNEKTVRLLNLSNLPNYETKFTGKIVVHMSRQNGSSAWFFITYLIYAFASKITRLSKSCFGQTIKTGHIHNSQLLLMGSSATTSGDGNAITIQYGNIHISCPTEQFIHCSIKDCDWNRFWISG